MVTKTIERISLGNGKTMVVVEPPKTESSIRKVYIPLFVVALLKKYKDKTDKYILSGKSKPTEPRALQYRFKRLSALLPAGVTPARIPPLGSLYKATQCTTAGLTEIKLKTQAANAYVCKIENANWVQRHAAGGLYFLASSL